VGAVSEPGQDDFRHERTVQHVNNHADAVKVAKGLVAPDGRIYLLDIDTAEWSEVKLT
jgi:hypothetical protein